ncbi:DUF4320 family protein [Virgibacillus halodenitrificans]|uniref:DUF4320 family protein n=1 Tax=Virgibacillus halodenitrificans TaxID=1482 RepID=UPI00045D3790|nr:DUF4320 family protein [Virgibacillus halodenitrificans]CDQ37704.1 hypothetical protein BN993_07266 [Virgibacillus halodenitrificans]
MQEGTIMELVKWFIGLFLIMMIVALAVFLFQMGDVNTFKQQVNYQIERNGGLTQEAMASINDYSERYFNGRFTVESDLLNTRVNYGDTVDYKVNGVFEIVIFAIPDVKMQFAGTGVSQVR